MQLRVFRHFVPVSVVLLASSDILLITGAFYQLLSQAETGTPIVPGASGFNTQFSAGLSFAAVTIMVSIGLYEQQSFMDLRLLLSKITVATILVPFGFALRHLLATGLGRKESFRPIPGKSNAYLVGLRRSYPGPFQLLWVEAF